MSTSFTWDHPQFPARENLSYPAFAFIGTNRKLGILTQSSKHSISKVKEPCFGKNREYSFMLKAFDGSGQMIYALSLKAGIFVSFAFKMIYISAAPRQGAGNNIF